VVGEALKADRTLAGLTLAELSARSGVSTAMISKIERGQVSASLSTLSALADAVGVPLINFFAATAERTDVAFVRAGEGVTVRRAGGDHGHVFRAIGRVTADLVEVETFLVTMEAEAMGAPPLYQHPGVEMMHVLEGSIRYRCGAALFDLGPGDSLTFGTKAPHGPVALLSPRVAFLAVLGRARPRSA
jgi:transcriptional regulator with XRE-family HTH domain